VRDDGQRPGRAVRRAALGARHRLAHLGPDRRAHDLDESAVAAGVRGRGPVRRAPGSVSTGAESVHWAKTTDSRETTTASHILLAVNVYVCMFGDCSATKKDSSLKYQLKTYPWYGLLPDFVSKTLSALDPVAGSGRD